MQWLIWLIDLLPHAPPGTWEHAVVWLIIIVAWLTLLVVVFPSVTRIQR